PSEMPLKVFSKKAFCEEYGDTVIADIGYSVKNAYIAGVHISVENLEQTKVFLKSQKIKTQTKIDKVILPADLCHGFFICFERNKDIGKV
ncbi:hypothetical protein, partial [Kordiimonas pumila]